MTTLHGKPVKIGDPVWDSVIGWSEVLDTDDSKPYNITTKNHSSYTKNGLLYQASEYPRLFWQEFTIPSHAFERPKVMVKKYIVYYTEDLLQYTTAHWAQKYFLNKEDFYSFNRFTGCKFVSLIMESEIEVESK